ncbi:hypothetical protein [Rahnella victoriana]|uniref:hypothetical protein n=1 Tax=Rahnella victoriana TaxID=1510570 RepID=UPI001F1DE512|nr:hypothetical protein [Rahnella victoriana]
MTLLYVQFSDEKEEVIIAYFAGPQPVEYWPNQGTVDISDPRWSTYFYEQAPFLQTMLPKPTMGGAAA